MTGNWTGIHSVEVYNDNLKHTLVDVPQKSYLIIFEKSKGNITNGVQFL